MCKHKQLLIDIVKEQAELFLLDAAEFYPFGTYVNNTGNIVPFSAFPGAEDYPPSTDVYIMLKDYIESKSRNDYVIAAIATDVTVTKNYVVYNAVKIELLEPDHGSTFVVYAYHIKPSTVEFAEIIL